MVMGLLGGSFVFIYYALFVWLFKGRRHHRVHQRVEFVAGRAADSVASKESPNGMKSGRGHLTSRLGWLETMLSQADSPLTVREYTLRWLAITICICLVADLLMGFVGCLLGLIIRCVSSIVVLRIRAQRRLRRFDEGLPEMLTVVSNSLRAGHSFAQAIHIVHEDLRGPLQDEMGRIEQETQMGLSLEEALMRAADRIGSTDFDLIVTAIGIQRQVGGNLAEVLQKIRDTIQDRIRIHREVKMLTAQGRMSATIFMVMPVALALLLYTMNRTYMGILFTTTPGLMLLGIAAIGQTVGFIFMRKIIRVSL